AGSGHTIGKFLRSDLFLDSPEHQRYGWPQHGPYAQAILQSGWTDGDDHTNRNVLIFVPEIALDAARIVRTTETVEIEVLHIEVDRVTAATHQRRPHATDDGRREGPERR